jgi:hypothetical protein
MIGQHQSKVNPGTGELELYDHLGATQVKFAASSVLPVPE